MALDTTATLDAACRLIRVVTGDAYGDGYRVTGIGVGNAEYGKPDTVWVLGNWNDKAEYINGERIVTDNSMSRLFDALERIGVDCEWLDEWAMCDGCSQIVRTSPDSYMWQPAYAVVGDSRYCVECATGDCLDETLDEYIGDAGKCLTRSLISERELVDAGFIRFTVPPCESGWHPGQTDTPDAEVQRFEAEHGTDSEWLFWLDESSQFYVRFSLFYRPVTRDEH